MAAIASIVTSSCAADQQYIAASRVGERGLLCNGGNERGRSLSGKTDMHAGIDAERRNPSSRG